MEQLGWRRYLVMAAMTLEAVLFCMGLVSVDAQAAVNWIKISGGEERSKDFVLESGTDGITAGEVVYQKDSNTLVLHDATIDAGGHIGIEMYGGKWFHTGKFTIRLEGDNTINTSQSGIDYTYISNLYIEGPGTLTINATGEAGIKNNSTNIHVTENAVVRVAGAPRYGVWFKFMTQLDTADYLEVKNGTLIATGSNRGIMMDAGMTDAQGVWIENGTLTAIATGTDGIGMDAYQGNMDMFGVTITGDSELTVFGPMAGYSNYRGSMEKSYTGQIVAKANADGMLIETGIQNGVASEHKTVYTETRWFENDPMDGFNLPLHDYPYVHYSAQRTANASLEVRYRTDETAVHPNVSVQLLRNGVAVGDPKELTDSSRTAMYENLLVRQAGDYTLSCTLTDPTTGADMTSHYNVYAYCDPAYGFHVIVSGGGTSTYDLDVVGIVEPNAGAGEPDAVEVTLYKDGVSTGQVLTLAAANGWRGTFENLLETQKSSYTIAVTAVSGGCGGYVYDMMSNLDEGWAFVFITGGDVPAPSGGDEADECHHEYEWEVYKAATATDDGIMRYRCKYCGDVEYEVPTAAYYVFNKDTQELIRNATTGATVSVETPIFISFHEMVKDALVERSDVTLVVTYKNEGKTYEMTIPAGSGEVLTSLFGESQYAGFLYLGGAFATIER